MFIGDDCKHPHFESACSRFTSNHVISKVAAAAGISVRTLHRLFQRHGRAPMETFEQCVFEKRLERAWRALSSGAAASVTDAALDCGFSDLSHFSRRFAQRFGLAPSALFRGR